MTNDVSRAHLFAAAEGIGNEALHLLLCDVVAGRTAFVPQWLAGIAAIGHTSGLGCADGRGYCVESDSRPAFDHVAALFSESSGGPGMTSQ